MKRIRAGRGLGDSLYLLSVVRHLVGKGEQLEVCTDYPDLFREFGERQVRLIPFTREASQIIAHYTQRKGFPKTDQFQDCCISAGIRGPVEFRTRWAARPTDLVAQLKWAERPVVLVLLPRAPMGRTDGFGAELLPDCRVIQRAIDRLKGKAFLVQIGAGEPLFRYSGIDLDLANKTTILDLLDVASVADGFLGYCSFLVPLAESMGKPLLVVWARRGLKARSTFIRKITPQKILHSQLSSFVFDDCGRDELGEAVDAFCGQIGSGRADPRQECRPRRQWPGRPREPERAGRLA